MKEKASFGSLLIGLYLFSVPIFSYSVDLGLTKISQAVGVIVILVAAYDLINKRSLRRNASLFLYISFTIWSVFTFVFAEYQSDLEMIITLVKITLITASSAILIKNHADFILCLFVFFISVFFAVGLNYDTIINLMSSSEIHGVDRLSGTFVNPNKTALYGLAIIWSGITLLISKKYKLIGSIIIYSGIILAILLVIYSGSRKGLLGLGLISLLLSWIILIKFGNSIFWKSVIFFFLISGVFVIMVLLYNSPFFYRLKTTFSGEASAQERMYLFKLAIDVWLSSLKNFVLGVGVNNFRFYNNLRLYSHTTVSETLVCTGLIGFILYFSSLITIFVINVKNYRIINLGMKSIILILLTLVVLVFVFNTAAVMYSDRLFMPILGIISSYSIFIRQSLLVIK